MIANRIKAKHWTDARIKYVNESFLDRVMGHTVWSQRNVLDLMLSELEAYGKALPLPDREIFREMLKSAAPIRPTHVVRQQYACLGVFDNGDID